MLFFKKNKPINLPADIDIFIYLIKIDYVGVKKSGHRGSVNKHKNKHRRLHKVLQDLL